MFEATFRSLLAHRVRLALTALAIALGTGFMAGSFVFTATLTHSLDSLFAQAATETDVIVQHVAPNGAAFGAGSGGTRPIPAGILASVRSASGVAAADGVVSGRAVLLGRNGKPLPGQFGIALSWPPDAPFQVIFTRRAGGSPTGPDQVMIDRASARQAHYAVGDRIEVAIGGQARPFTVSGITGYGSADSVGGGSMAIFSLPTAQRLFGLADRYSQIDVKAAAGISAPQLRGQVAQVLPPGVQAVTAASAAASQAQQLNGQLGFLTYFFAGFAGVSLLVGAFVIWNTFSIMVGQRARERRCCAPWAPDAARCSAACSVRPRCSAPGQPRWACSSASGWPAAWPRCCPGSGCPFPSPGSSSRRPGSPPRSARDW